MPTMNQTVAARYIGANYDLSEVRRDEPETWRNSNELIVAMDVLCVQAHNRALFVRNALFAYHGRGA